MAVMESRIGTTSRSRSTRNPTLLNVAKFLAMLMAISYRILCVRRIMQFVKKVTT